MINSAEGCAELPPQSNNIISCADDDSETAFNEDTLKESKYMYQICLEKMSMPVILLKMKVVCQINNDFCFSENDFKGWLNCTRFFFF